MGDEPVPPFNSYAGFFAALLIFVTLALFLIWMADASWDRSHRDYCPAGQVLVTTPDGIGRCSR